MSYVQGSSLQKVFKGSLKYRAEVIENALEAHFGDTPMNIVAVHEDHAFEAVEGREDHLRGGSADVREEAARRDGQQDDAWEADRANSSS